MEGTALLDAPHFPRDGSHYFPSLRCGKECANGGNPNSPSHSIQPPQYLPSHPPRQLPLRDAILPLVYGWKSRSGR